MIMELETHPKEGGLNDGVSPSQAPAPSEDATARSSKRMKEGAQIAPGNGHNASTSPPAVGAAKAPYPQQQQHHAQAPPPHQQTYGYPPQGGPPPSQQPYHPMPHQQQMYPPGAWQQQQQPPGPQQGPGGPWVQQPPQGGQMGIFRQQQQPGGPPQQKQDQYSPNREQQQQQWGNQPRLPPMMSTPNGWGSPGPRMGGGGGGAPHSGIPQHVMGQPHHTGQPQWRGGYGAPPSASSSMPPHGGIGGMAARTPPQGGGMGGRGVGGGASVASSSMAGVEHDDMSVDHSNKSGGGGGKKKGKDKVRGQYVCGRCGAPKKGHVCPYQPKLKRRPDEPPPEVRNASTQVELDEFMVMRRLNLEIQGFPESYATEPPYDDNVGSDSYEYQDYPIVGGGGSGGVNPLGMSSGAMTSTSSGPGMDMDRNGR